MEQILKVVRDRLQAAAPEVGDHPDPDLLTAFAEQLLGVPERARVLEHLAQCAGCREVLSLAAPELVSVEGAAATRTSGWFRWPVLRWAAVAACVVVVGTAVTLHFEKRGNPAPMVASRQTAPPPAEDANAQKTQVPSAPSAAIDKLADKAEARRAPRPTREAAAGTLAKQRDQAMALHGRLSAPAFATAPRAQPAAPPASQVAAAAPAPSPTRKSADQERADEQGKGESISLAAPKSVNEVVTVEGKNLPATEVAEVIPGKAKEEKDARKKILANQKAVVASGATAALVSGGRANPTPAGAEASLRADGKLTPRWTLSAEGAVQSSFDGGQTWRTIPVASNVVFRALATVGPDVWVGGANGALYHSSDGGEHWTQLKPQARGAVLTSDITGLDFTDAQHGKLTTASDETWITTDGGQSWQKK